MHKDVGQEGGGHHQGEYNRIRDSLSDYIRFQLRHNDAQSVKDNVRKCFCAEKEEYNGLDARFLSLTYGQRKAKGVFTGTHVGVGVGRILLVENGLEPDSMRGLKSAAEQAVDEINSGLGGGKLDDALKVLQVRDIRPSHDTSSYEAEVNLDFFKRFAPEGGERMRELLDRSGIPEEGKRMVYENDPLEVSSKRIVGRVTILDKDEKIGGFIVRLPKDEAEVNAGLYAASRVVEGKWGGKTLGPDCVRAGDYLFEEDISFKGNSLRDLGMVMTKGEALGLGTQTAADLAAMISDGKYLYSSDIPAKNMFITGKGREGLRTRMVGWNAPIDLRQTNKKTGEALVKFMMGQAYLFRGELRRETHNFLAWSGYRSTLRDPEYVPDESLRMLFKKYLDETEKRLSDPSHTIREMPVGEDEAARWRDFFIKSRTSELHPKSEEEELRKALLNSEGGVIDVMKRTLHMDLTRAGILPPVVANKLVDDMLFRLRIQRNIRLASNEILEAVSSGIDEVNVAQSGQDEDRRLQISKGQAERIKDSLIKEIGPRGRKSFPEIFQPLTNIFIDEKVDEELVGQAMDGVRRNMTVRGISKLTFTSTPGEVSWLRPWATHILVRGPHPESEIMAVYRFKPTHSSKPSTEIEPSQTASDEDIGPKVVWSADLDGKKGVMLEEYFTPINPLALRADSVEKAAENTAIMIFRMFSLGRIEGKSMKSIHAFDGMERGHYNLRRVGGSLKPCLVDFGEPKTMDRHNRRELMAVDIGILADKIVDEWPHGLPAAAVFEHVIEESARSLADDPEYRKDLEGALSDYRKSKTSTRPGAPKTGLPKKWVKRFQQMDELKKDYEAGRLVFDDSMPAYPIHADVPFLQGRWGALSDTVKSSFKGSMMELHWISLDVEKSREPDKMLTAYESVIKEMFQDGTFQDKTTAFTTLRNAINQSKNIDRQIITPQDVKALSEAIKSRSDPDQAINTLSEILPDVKKQVLKQRSKKAGVKTHSRKRAPRSRRMREPRETPEPPSRTKWMMIAEKIREAESGVEE